MTVKVTVKHRSASDADGLKPSFQDSKGFAWNVGDIHKYAAADINIGTYFQNRVKDSMTPDFKAAAETCDAASDVFNKAFSLMLNAEQSMTAAAKKTSGNVRKAADDLAQGLAKVEKTANFERLDKYVGLLERAATAMTVLAELEKSGKLDKIASALK